MENSKTDWTTISIVLGCFVILIITACIGIQKESAYNKGYQQGQSDTQELCNTKKVQKWKYDN